MSRLLLLALCSLFAGILAQCGMHEGCSVLLVVSPISVAATEGGKRNDWYARHWQLHREGAKFCAEARECLSFVDEPAPGEAIAAVLCSSWYGIPHRGRRSNLKRVC